MTADPADLAPFQGESPALSVVRTDAHIEERVRMPDGHLIRLQMSPGTAMELAARLIDAARASNPQLRIAP